MELKIYNESASELEKRINAVELYTSPPSSIKLFPYGRHGLEITSVNNGLNYIESPKINGSSVTQHITKDYIDCTNPLDLLNQACFTLGMHTAFAMVSENMKEEHSCRFSEKE